MEISVDSGCNIGIISSECKIAIKDASPYEKSLQSYTEAKVSKDPKKVETAKSELLSTFATAIKPGEASTISGAEHTMRGEFPGADKVSATAKWYPEKTSLRVKFDVVDAFFSTHADPRYPWDASCVGVYVCPTGAAEDIHQLFFVPDGKNGEARLVQEVTILKHPETIKAAWQRTKRGYTMDIRIPWNCIGSYDPDWKIMPVNAVITSKPPDKYRVLTVMNGSRLPLETAETYVALTRK